jgi:hypothetical protein
VITALIYAHMFGLRQDQLVESKLGASDQSRKSFDLLARDIRSSKLWYVGNGNAAGFVAISSNAPQRGNAINLNLTVNTNIFVRYFFDTNTPGNFKLCRMHSPNSSTITIVASNLIGNLTFTAERYDGSIFATNVVETDLTHKGVIHTTLEFCQYQYPKTLIGSNYLYDRYKLELKYSAHVPD